MLHNKTRLAQNPTFDALRQIAIENSRYERFRIPAERARCQVKRSREGRVRVPVQVAFGHATTIYVR